MSNVIEDFSVKVEMVNPNNGYKYTDHVNLEVQEGWHVFGDTKVAYTFNSDSENTARQLFKALEKYKALVFVTGVTGRTKNWLIQCAMKRHMERLFGDRVTIEDYRMASTLFRLKD